MKFIILAFTVLAFTVSTSAQTPSMAGKWKITWQQSDTPNFVTLSDQNGVVAGSYLSDTLNENCPISGTTSNGKISLHIVCSKWDIWLRGQFSDTVIDGTYAAYGNTTGTFKMEKYVCMLPEGCTK